MSLGLPLGKTLAFRTAFSAWLFFAYSDRLALSSAIEFVLQELNTKASRPPHPLEKLLAADVQQAINLQSTLETTLAPYRMKAN